MPGKLVPLSGRRNEGDGVSVATNVAVSSRATEAHYHESEATCLNSRSSPSRCKGEPREVGESPRAKGYRADNEPATPETPDANGAGLLGELASLYLAHASLYLANVSSVNTSSA